MGVALGLALSVSMVKCDIGSTGQLLFSVPLRLGGFGCNHPRRQTGAANRGEIPCGDHGRSFDRGGSQLRSGAAFLGVIFTGCHLSSDVVRCLLLGLQPERWGTVACSLPGMAPPSGVVRHT